MDSFTRRVFSSIKSAYNNINPSTLTGAIDIIVVKQEDGTLRCTPFHVRFGKLGVIQSHQKKVYIAINDNPIDDLWMQLGEAGEAFFIDASEIIIPHHPLEISNTNLFSIDNESSRPSLSRIDRSPQRVNQLLDEEKAHETNESAPTYAFDQPEPTTNVDVLHSNIIVTPPSNNSNGQASRRRQKRRAANTRRDADDQASSNDDEHELLEFYTATKRRSRARKRESTPVSAVTAASSIRHSDDEQDRPLTVTRKRSASENDLPFFQIDDDQQSISSTPFVDAHSRLNSIDSRKKSLIIPREESDSDETESSQESVIDEQEMERKNSRALSNPIPIEQPSAKATNGLFPAGSPIVEEPKTLTSKTIEALLSQSAPEGLAALTAAIPIRISQSGDPSAYYLNEDFSPPTTFQGPSSLRPTSPKSDTEYELDKSSQSLISKQSTLNDRSSGEWQWKWGELPEHRQHIESAKRPSVLSYWWPSAKKATPMEGVYLSDITSNRCDDPSRYLPTMDYHQTHRRATNDDDQESGKGNSMPQSPFREHEASFLLGDVQLSLCGHINKLPAINDDVFNAHLVSFETFANNPAIVNDSTLVVRVAGKYYNWAVGSALIASASIFNKQLPVETIEQLQEKHMPPIKTRTTTVGSWWPFYGKRSELPSDSTKTPTVTTPSDAIAMAAKAESIATPLKNQDSTDSNKSRKTSKADNDSEQEDSEVTKLTAEMEKQRQAQPPTTLAHQSSSLRKTMVLSSDQLKQLNLNLGVNKVEFSVTTALQGTTVVESNIFFFDHHTKFVISDIDGTITKSDVFGHLLPLVGKDWSHDGIAEFFNAIHENGYQFIYLSARAIGQSRITRNFLRNIKQCGSALPLGPLLVSPDSLMIALYREVIAKKPEDFKIECLKNIATLFPNANPFYAGFGNRINDQWAYTAVGIPVTRIFTINPRGEIVRQKFSQALSSSYKNLHEVVDLIFPPMDSFSSSETYSAFTYWRPDAMIDSFENEIRAELEEIAQRQKSAKANAKAKGTPSTPTVIPKTTPTTTVTKPGGEKLLTLAQATENTVKR